MRNRSFGILVFGVLTAGAAASPARADDASDAKDLFERGRVLRAQNNCADALPLFQQAYALYPSALGSLRNIAVCQESLNRFASARDSWIEVRRVATSSGDPKYAGWGDDADKAIARLGSKVSKVTIDVAVVGPSGQPQSANGVDVTIEGQPLPRERFGTPVDHDPGIYVVRATSPWVGAADQQTVELNPGDSKRITLHVNVKGAPLPDGPAPEEGSDSAPAQAAASDAASGSSGTPSLRVAGWVALGVGAAGVAGAVTSLVLRQEALSDLKDVCPNYDTGACKQSQQTAVLSDLSRGRTASTLFTVFGAAGLVGTVAGVAILTLTKSSDTPTAVFVSPTGVSARGSF